MTDRYGRRSAVEEWPGPTPAPEIPNVSRGRTTLRDLELELAGRGGPYYDLTRQRRQPVPRGPELVATLDLFDERIGVDSVFSYPSSKARLITLRVLGYNASNLRVLPEITVDGQTNPRPVGDLLGCRTPELDFLSDLLVDGNTPLIEAEAGPYELPRVIGGFTLEVA